MTSQGVTMWGHEGKRYHGRYHRIDGHHLLALTKNIYTREEFNLNFGDFSHFLVTNDSLWWPMWWLYRDMRVGGTMDDILGMLGTIRWPLANIYTQDKRSTSNLVVLAILGHKWLSMTSHGVSIWGHEGRSYYGWHHRIVGHHLLALRAHLSTR